jgi:hypothetical protein
VSYGWSGTAIPTKNGYDFDPADRTYSNVTIDQTGQDYAASVATWNVTASAGENGTVDPGTLQTVVHGDTAVFVIVPEEHYRVATPVGGSCGGSYTGNPADDENGITYTTGPITADCTVSATFASAAPVATTNPVSSAGETTAMLNGEVVPGGLETTAWFEWGTTAGYGNRFPGFPDAGYDAGREGSNPISDLLMGLTASTEYHYRMVAENSAGTSYGGDRSFSTREIDSTCDEHRPIKIEGEFEYDSFFDLSGNLSDGDTILLGRTPVTEDVIFDLPGTAFLLAGGSSCDFGARTGTFSTIYGSLTIVAGEVIVDGLLIE